MSDQSFHPLPIKIIINLSTDLDSLGQDWRNKSICKVTGWDIKKKLSSRTLFSFYMSRWRIYLSNSRPLCVWSIFWPSSHQDISNLSTDLNFLGQVWGNKTICNMKRWVIKIFLSLHFSCHGEECNSGFHVCLCVWSMFWPSSHQDISNLSTNLDFLG